MDCFATLAMTVIARSPKGDVAIHIITKEQKQRIQ